MLAVDESSRFILPHGTSSFILGILINQKNNSVNFKNNEQFTSIKTVILIDIYFFLSLQAQF